MIVLLDTLPINKPQREYKTCRETSAINLTRVNCMGVKLISWISRLCFCFYLAYKSVMAGRSLSIITSLYFKTLKPYRNVSKSCKFTCNKWS